MNLRLRLPRPRLPAALAAFPLVRRLLVGAAWLGGALVLAGAAFVLSFFFAMRVEMRSTVIQVPDVGGRTVEEASQLLAPLDLKIEVAEQRHDPAVASGRVLQQVPPPGATVRRGRKIKVILSLGGRVLVVPDLVGQADRAVEIELRQDGFALGEEAHVPSATVPAGAVLAQVPPPATPAVPNSRVHRLVSDGPPLPVWVMPDLGGLPREVAESWIGRTEFRRGSVRRVRMNGRAPGTVVGQLPLPGYPVRSKDVIELTVAQ